MKRKFAFWILCLLVVFLCSCSNDFEKHEHTFSDKWTYNETYHYHECTDQGCTERKDEAAHQFKTNVIEPTYENDGYTRHTCSVCGYYYDNNFVDKLEHNYSFDLSYNETHHYHLCIDEGYGDLKKDIEAHQFTDTILEPTFENKGYTRHTCNICGYYYDDTYVDKLEHHYSTEWNHDDNSHYHECTDQGCTERKDEAAHQFTTNVIEPTYTTKGYTRHTCSICGYYYDDTYVDKLEHHYSTEWSHDDTNHYHECMDQGYEELKTDIANHDFSIKNPQDIYLRSKATCEDKATYYYVCSICGAVSNAYYEYGECLGHSYEKVLASSNGKSICQCKHCNELLFVDSNGSFKNLSKLYF